MANNGSKSEPNRMPTTWWQKIWQLTLRKQFSRRYFTACLRDIRKWPSPLNLLLFFIQQAELFNTQIVPVLVPLHANSMILFKDTKTLLWRIAHALILMYQIPPIFSLSFVSMKCSHVQLSKGQLKSQENRIQ